MKNKVLITGATGFVGKNLKPFLIEKDYEVSTLSRKRDGNYSYNSITSEDFNSYHTVIHLAGKAHDLKNTSDDKEYFEVNTDLTTKLFDLFLESDCKTFIYLSSVKAAADTVDGILTEDHIPDPKTAYGKSKLVAEEYLRSKAIPDGKRVYILRPCMIHGPDNKGNLNLLLNIVKKGIPYPLGAYENKRSFVHIDNLCQVIQILITKKPDSNTFNIADDYPISTVEIVKEMKLATNKNIPIWNVPKRLIKILGKLGTVLHLPLTTERLDKLTENYVVSNLKLKQILKIDAPFDTKIGMKKTLDSLK